MKGILFCFIASSMLISCCSAQTKPGNATAIGSRGMVSRDAAYADPQAAIQALLQGNERFATGKSLKPRQDASTLKKLETGQHPFAVVVGCSDSRVPNELIFDQGFGDLFIIRTAGQVSADASYASMEYAVENLGTKLIVVLGHTECGAVAATLSGNRNLPGHLPTLTEAIRPAVQEASKNKGSQLDNAVRQNVLNQVEALKNLDPILKKRYAEGSILIIGAIYNIHTGSVEFLQASGAN